MASPEKNETNRLIGCWRHPTGGFEICYFLEGKKHSEYRKSETLARQRAAHWKHVLEGTPVEQENEHPVLYWERKLREAAEHLLSNPGDESAVDLGKTIASMATAGLRAAAFYPPPTVQVSPDGAPIGDADLQTMKTEDIAKLLEGKE